jgi:hypothetical protein
VKQIHKNLEQNNGKTTDEHIARIKHYLSEQDDSELQRILKLKDNPEFLTFHTIQELKKRKDERTRKYKKDIEIAGEILMGRKSIRRLSEEEEQGRIAGGRRNVEASIIIGRRGGTYQKNGSQQRLNFSEQEQLLKDYALSVGIWNKFDDIATKAFKQFQSGAESKVFLYKDENGEGYVIKVTDYKVMGKTPMDFLDNHISLANYLSPQTKYELIGFTEYRQRFQFVVKQPYIEGTELEYYVQAADNVVDEQIKQEKRIKEWMKSEYKARFAGSTSYENERYIFNDLHLKNVLEKDNRLYLIDLIVKLNTSDVGGNAEYLPFKIIQNKL